VYNKGKHLIQQSLMKINVFVLWMNNEPGRRTQASPKYCAGHSRRVG